MVKEEGVFTNIVLSHSGYDVDKRIAANASEKISLIVGAHSHTFLFTGGMTEIYLFKESITNIDYTILVIFLIISMFLIHL